jgi:hypothetical protein
VLHAIFLHEEMVIKQVLSRAQLVDYHHISPLKGGWLKTYYRMTASIRFQPYISLQEMET